jgi:hypothetical protein
VALFEIRYVGYWFVAVGLVLFDGFFLTSLKCEFLRSCLNDISLGIVVFLYY